MTRKREVTNIIGMQDYNEKYLFFLSHFLLLLSTCLWNWLTMIVKNSVLCLHDVIKLEKFYNFHSIVRNERTFFYGRVNNKIL